MDFQEIIGQVVGYGAQRVRTGDPVRDRAIAFLGRLQQLVLGPWSHLARSGIECSTLKERTKCYEPAIGACAACREPVCLEHGFVSVTGAVLCPECVQAVIRSYEQTRGPRLSEERSRVTGQGEPRGQTNDADERKKHLSMMGLRLGATVEDIQSAYRKLAPKVHPDRFPEHRKAAAQKKFVALGQSRDWLLRDLERRAAA